jgi:hypothetical protein
MKHADRALALLQKQIGNTDEMHDISNTRVQEFMLDFLKSPSGKFGFMMRDLLRAA